MRPSRHPPSWSTGKWIAAILALAVHVGFVLFLIFSVTWQNPKPEPVTAELYAPPVPVAEPKPEAEPPKPAPEPPKPPPEPAKPPPEPPKPPPKVEPPRPSKAEIALKEKQELERRKEQAERERKEKEKREATKREAAQREAEKKQQEEKRLAEARERQTREAEALRAQAERERLALQQAAARAAQSKAIEDYIRRIKAKVTGNVNLPPDIAGNPEAIFDVVQLPTGEIIDVQLKKSSGVRAYDEAVQRAIIKSSPLPLPGSPELFSRSLTLRFRPKD